MKNDDLVNLNFAMPDGSELRLHASRFDERQRRSRITLPKVSTCWDYAPLIDIVRKEPGFDKLFFTGKTAAQWLCDLQIHRSPDYQRFRQWYAAVVDRQLDALKKRQRVPDNHYCIEIASPPLKSSLPRLVRELGLKRSSAGQWLGTLRTLVTKGVKPEELEESGVLVRLQRFGADAQLTQSQILQMIDLSHVVPKFTCESQYGFVSKGLWLEMFRRIPEREFKRRGLLGRQSAGAWHVMRFKHQALGWSIVRSRYSDLFTRRKDWWVVLDDNGHTVKQPLYGFDTAEDAIEYAQSQISQRFASYGRDQAMPKWERFSLPGGDGYQEILLQLDDWPGNYQPRHYRTRNVLVHLRTGVRQTQDGRRVLFLDEIQSDWHADLHAEVKPESRKRRDTPPPGAPFRKEWPLLSLKLMLWWAQRSGVDGLAWSTAELQLARWRGYGPPETLYRSVIPDAAQILAKSLGLPFESTQLSVRTNSRRIELDTKGWIVRNANGCQITKPFRSRHQAESFADQTGSFLVINVPVIWFGSMAPLRMIPLYGTAPPQVWHQAEHSRGQEINAMRASQEKTQRIRLG
jgi:hypothetical protein